MATPQPYQGHRSWNAWNVSLWVGNDETLYRAALRCIERTRSKSGKPRIGLATHKFLHIVGPYSKTPDGAIYNPLCVRLALEGLLE